MKLSRLLRNLRSASLTLTLLMSASALQANQELALPSLGDASSRTISPQLERQIGESFLKQLHSSLRTSDDPLIKYYAQNQLIELAQHSDLREAIMSVVVIDNEQINAFAAPGGVIGVNLGLMLAAQDVHEYAAVMAHELAHLSQRHFARGVEEQRQQTIPMLASVIAALIIGAVGGGDAGIAAISSAQAAAQSNQLKFSREREIEADRIGMNTLVRANHDPAAMARMFGRMQNAYRFTRRPPEFLLTHPLSESRIADARSQAMDMPVGNTADSLEYQLMRTRAQVHFQASPAEGINIYRKRLRDNPNDRAAQYGLALSLSKEGQHQEALDLVENAFQTAQMGILATAAYAELLIEADRTNQARTMLNRQLDLNPDNAPLSMLYARALNRDGDHEGAEAVLERQSEVRPRDIDVWYQLAETAGLAGNTSGVHLARAEYFMLHGSYHRAIQHLEYAQRLIRRTDPQMVTKLAQRIQDLRTAIRMAQS